MNGKKERKKYENNIQSWGGGCFNYLAILISQISKREEAIVRGDLVE